MLTGEPTTPLYDPLPEKEPPQGARSIPGPEEIRERFLNALKSDNYEDMSAALAQGADINMSVSETRYHYGGYGRDGSHYTHTYATTLFYALDKQNQKLLDFLIAHGADVNRPDAENKALLTMAVYKEIKPLVRAVVSASGFDRSAAVNKAALQTAADKKHSGPAQKELYQYLKSVLSDPWQKVDDETVSRVSFDKDGMLEVTDQFNFKAGERIRHIRDFEFGAVQTSSCFFADMPANMRAQLKEAWEALKAADGGKNIDPYEPLPMRHIQRKRSAGKA